MSAFGARICLASAYFKAVPGMWAALLREPFAVHIDISDLVPERGIFLSASGLDSDP